MSVGNTIDGTANMNGFLPFQIATTGAVSMWNTNIANAAIDPNNASFKRRQDLPGKVHTSTLELQQATAAFPS